MSALWPTGSTSQPRLSASYGPRTGIPGARNFHYGVDIPMGYGETVRAAVKGVAIYSGVNGTLGEQVVIRDNAGRQFLYPHMQRGSRIAAGAEVEQGGYIGRVGLTGLTTGPHSCFRTFEGSWQRDANARNPEQFMAQLNGGALASTEKTILGIYREEGEDSMQYVVHDESKGVFGIDWESIVHFTTMKAAQFNANLFTAEDKITPVNTEQFQDILRGNAIDFSHPDRLINEDPGGSWSRDQVNTLLLERLAHKLGA